MNEIIKVEDIQTRIFTIRQSQVMLDSDLAEMYGVQTRVLNQAVKRNIDRFPNQFRFQLIDEEIESLKSQIEISNSRSQIVTLNKPDTKQGGNIKYKPYVFTEQGVSMLSAVLRSKTAIKVSIQIIDAFVNMRRFISQNINAIDRICNIEQKQIETDIKLLSANTKIDKILNALEANETIPKQNIFYNGQVFDAYTLIADIIRSAQRSIILIDNYIDDTVFKQLAKRNESVNVTIYSKTDDKIVKQDLKKHNAQYPPIELKKLTTAHDRFLIIDTKTVYHFGASLKDAGRKPVVSKVEPWFACSKLSIDANDIVSKL